MDTQTGWDGPSMDCDEAERSALMFTPVWTSAHADASADEERIHVETLIIACDIVSRAFVRANYLQDNGHNHLGNISLIETPTSSSTLSSDSSSSPSSPPSSSSAHSTSIIPLKEKILSTSMSFYKVSSGDTDTSSLIVGVLADGAVPLDVSHAWCACIFGHIAPHSLVLLDSISIGSYFPADPSAGAVAPLLRRLQTTTTESSSSNHVDWLETPNTISGLSAASLSFCQLRQLAAVVFVSLRDHSFDVSLATLRAFEGGVYPLLKETPVPSYKKQLSALNVTASGAMYM
eukprot:TRINITY_DN4728_c0_g1_i1.p1 TRINITY_DN4728_c0_g1~~TRINITY_DN4728_c0_g1_i1.p1  ORF type:complete len:309 (-),score=49.24 TRINITY_DN4728_c0_g1_i1:31-900(-)